MSSTLVIYLYLARETIVSILLILQYCSGLVETANTLKTDYHYIPKSTNESIFSLSAEIGDSLLDYDSPCVVRLPHIRNVGNDFLISLEFFARDTKNIMADDNDNNDDSSSVDLLPGKRKRPMKPESTKRRERLHKAKEKKQQDLAQAQTPFRRRVTSEFQFRVDAEFEAALEKELLVNMKPLGWRKP